jgi:hypothetical protein
MTDAKKAWDEYVESERRRVAPPLARLGFTLDEDQPQTIGERYLTRPVGGGRKVVFFGRRSGDEMRVVVKTSSEEKGRAELAHEYRSRTMLANLKFAYAAFALPEVLAFDDETGVLISEYIEQDMPFLARPLKEQFTLALEAFKAQESAQAVTAGHWDNLKKLMGSADYYIKPGEYRKIEQYVQDIVGASLDDEDLKSKIRSALDETIALIHRDETALERYDGFLTHWDFIPQNFRIRGGTLYLLDLTSVRFGNKYEGWARFINFMTLYNPPLAEALVAYVGLNRAPEELLCLKLMRLYRLIELLRYYATWLEKTEGNLRKLTLARIAFWTDALAAVLADTNLAPETIERYQATRDSLRSDDEKRRQKGLH